MDKKNKNGFKIILSVVAVGVTAVYFASPSNAPDEVGETKQIVEKVNTQARNIANNAPIKKDKGHAARSKSYKKIDPEKLHNWLHESRVSFRIAEKRIADLRKEWRKKPFEEKMKEGDLLVLENEIFFDEILGANHPAKEFYIDRFKTLTGSRGFLLEGAQSGAIPHGDAVTALGTVMTDWQVEMEEKFSDEEYIRLFGVPKEAPVADVLGLTAKGTNQAQPGESDLNMASLYVKNEVTGQLDLNTKLIQEQEAKAKEEIIQAAIASGDVSSAEEFNENLEKNGMNIPLDSLDNMKKADKIVMAMEDKEAEDQIKEDLENAEDSEEAEKTEEI